MTALVGAITAWAILVVTTWWMIGISWGVLLGAVLSVSLLHFTIRLTDARGWHLIAILVALWGGIGVVNIQVESVFINLTPFSESLATLVFGLGRIFVVSWILVVTSSRMQPADGHRPSATPVAGWAWRVPVAAVCYVVLFVIAGSMVLPFLRDFYREMSATGQIELPNIGGLLTLELARGFVYVVAMTPFIWVMAGRRWTAGLHLGLCLAVFGGVTPLLMPVDAVLPAYVRHLHMVEIGVSNFVFGLVSAGLLIRTQSPRDTDEQTVLA